MRTGRLGIGAGLGLALLLSVNAGRAQAQGEEAPPPDKPPPAFVPLPGTTGTHTTVPQPNGGGVEGHGPLEGHEGHDEAADTTTESDRGFYIYADYLLMRARRRALDYVISDPVLNGSVTGNLNSLNWGTDSGYRLSGGYRLGHGWEIGASYLYFHTSDNRSTVQPPGGALYATLTAPGIDQVTSASANGNLNLNLINVEFAKRLDFQDGFGMRLSGGLQVADISQKFNALYSGATAGANPDSVSEPINFDGIGVRVGGEGWWHAPECWGTWGRGFGVYAKLYGSLLSGEFHTRTTEIANGGTQTIVDVSDKFLKIVPVTETGIGIGWSTQNVMFRVGYELYNFFGLVDNVDFVDSNSFGKTQHRTSDLSLEALVISLGFFY